jgi:hypothetical protein
MQGGKVTDPVFMARDVVDLQGEADDEVRMIPSRLVNEVDVFVQLPEVMRQLSNPSWAMGEWSENPISANPRFTARAAYWVGKPVACRQSGVCMW